MVVGDEGSLATLAFVSFLIESEAPVRRAENWFIVLKGLLLYTLQKGQLTAKKINIY